jgi:hypothetical protein
MRLAIECMYTATTTTCFDMPEGKTWDDVEHWHVKWGTLHLTFKDGTEEQITTDYIELDAIDVKRPDAVGIHPCNEDDHVDWTIKIDEEDRNAELSRPKIDGNVELIVSAANAYADIMHGDDEAESRERANEIYKALNAFHATVHGE